MASNGNENKRERVALAIACGYSVKAAARRCAVGPRTAYRWYKEPDFKQRISDLRGELFDRAVGTLSQISGMAANVLKQLLATGTEKTRLGAARTVLDAAIKTRDFAEMARRLDIVEEELQKVKAQEP